MSTDASDFICSVCGEPASAAASAECNWCDQRYHLNQRNDVDAKDCGQVWIDEQFLALQFACNTCIGKADGAVATPPGLPIEFRRSSPTPGTSRPRRYRRRS